MADRVDLGRLALWAAENLGFDQRALRLDRLGDVANHALQRLGSAQALAQALDEREPALVAALVSAVTVGETYFFRQREHFDLLAQLPTLRQPTLTAWSAGCSTGEEAYSLAAVLRSLSRLDAPALTVWGTDINEASLAQARAAEYGRWSWRDNSNPVAVRMLMDQALEPPNRACARFARHNLMEPPTFDGQRGERFDLVFCRNVLVYFSPLAAARAMAAMTDAIRPGGWLVLGNTDLPGSPTGFKRIGPPALCVYAKDARPVPRNLAATAMDAAAEAVRLASLPLKALVKAAPRPAPVPAADSAAQDPVEWHRQVLGLIEEGRRAAALKELARLTAAHPGYLPGRFEHALTLRRAGHPAAAAAELKSLLEQVQGRDLDEEVPGPEPLSLEFYVNSAKSFISSTGGDA